MMFDLMQGTTRNWRCIAHVFCLIILVICHIVLYLQDISLVAQPRKGVSNRVDVDPNDFPTTLRTVVQVHSVDGMDENVLIICKCCGNSSSSEYVVSNLQLYFFVYSCLSLGSLTSLFSTLVHGLGDSEKPYVKFAQTLALPQTTCLVVRAPLKVPLIDNAYCWLPTFVMEIMGSTGECCLPTLKVY